MSAGQKEKKTLIIDCLSLAYLCLNLGVMVNLSKTLKNVFNTRKLDIGGLD